MSPGTSGEKNSFDGLSPLPQSGLRVVEQVYLALRDAMADGVITPGTRLLEAQLASQLGVSRTPVREALQRLEAERLAIRVRGRGLVFADIGETDVSDLGQIRIVLDSLAGGMASSRAKEDDWEKANAYLDALEEAVNARSDRQSKIRSAHRSLHRHIYELAFSRLVSAFLENNVLQFLEISTRLHAPTGEMNVSIIEDHRAYMDALRCGDPLAAAEAARKHAQAGVEQVKKQIISRKFNGE